MDIARAAVHSDAISDNRSGTSTGVLQRPSPRTSTRPRPRAYVSATDTSGSSAEPTADID